MSTFRIDRRLSLGLLLALLIYSGTGVWWMASLSSTVADSQRRIAALEADGKAAQARGDDIVQRLARLEAVLQVQTTLLSDLRTQGKK